ncbi:MAG: hypothetical protein H6765_10015 [Candidatus Peribacteria bacterium]|nr:MAG: hypothetical protein H6765_10015 [Candidatus Peribacteria bacterium]
MSRFTGSKSTVYQSLLACLAERTCNNPGRFTRAWQDNLTDIGAAINLYHGSYLTLEDVVEREDRTAFLDLCDQDSG